MVDVITAITKRHSVRAFLPKAVETQQIIKLLETARYAPSGVNSQPWRVIAVTGDLIKHIGEAIIQARENGIPENPDYAYYPHEWFEPYKSRRKACGLALYSSLGIKIDEQDKRKEAWYRNYHFFGAPVGLLFFVDKRMAKGSWVDMGMFIQNVMLTACGLGLATCPQASLAEYPDLVREQVGISRDFDLICGMALGYEDPTAAINGYRTIREPVSTFTTFLGFKNN